MTYLVFFLVFSHAVVFFCGYMTHLCFSLDIKPLKSRETIRKEILERYDEIGNKIRGKQPAK